jgi:hypothetical protein
VRVTCKPSGNLGEYEGDTNKLGERRCVRECGCRDGINKLCGCRGDINKLYGCRDDINKLCGCGDDLTKLMAILHVFHLWELCHSWDWSPSMFISLLHYLFNEHN